MSNAPTLINYPPPPSDPITPSEIPSRSGTPNSATTSMSELSTVAIKDGHRGHLPHHHHHQQAPSGLSHQLDAERADRISRLAGLERFTAARNLTPIGQLTPGAAAASAAAAPVNTTQGYFDAQGNPGIGRERSTVGSASATGSVGARTTWAGSEAGDMDKMSESQDMDMDTSSVGGMSDEGGSLVAFGEGARTPARQSTISVPGVASKATTPTARDARMIDGMTYDQNVVDTASENNRGGLPTSSGAAEQAARIVRENMDTTSNDRISGRQPGALGKLPFEK